MKKQWLAILTVLCLMVTMVAPTAFAAEAIDGDDTATVRIEAENYDTSGEGSDSSTRRKELAEASAGALLDNMQVGQIFRLAKDVDLTGLKAITVAVGHANKGAEYGIYIDGTKTAPGLKIATIVGDQASGWNDFKPYTVDITTPPVMLAGKHDLYIRVDKASNSGAVYGGNLDYVDLIKGAAPMVSTKIETEWASQAYAEANGNMEYSHRSNPSTRPTKIYYFNESGGHAGSHEYGQPALEEGTYVSKLTALDGTTSGDKFYLGEYDLTGLHNLKIKLANEVKTGMEYAFYIDGTANSLGTKIASLTGVGTGGWTDFKEIDVPVIASADVLAGRHTLFLAMEYPSFDYAGNVDYVSFDTMTVNTNALTTSSTTNFQNYIYKEGQAEKENKDDFVGLGVTATEKLVLGYANVRFDNLTSMALYYSAERDTIVNVYKGAPSEDNQPLTTFNLNSNSRVGGVQWWEGVNMRITHHDMSGLNLTGTGDLYFEFIRNGGTYVGNLSTFTLYYNEALTPSTIVEGENYGWGYSASKSGDNWRSSTFLNGTKNGDIFYFGKVNLDDLKEITLRLATAGGDCTANFYADMVIPNDLTRYRGQDGYSSETGFTGGTLIGSASVTSTNGWATNDWQKYSYFNAPINTDLTGEHHVYMALTSSDAKYTGNVDYVEFVGVESVNTTSSLLGNVTIVGDGSITYSENLNYGEETTIKASANKGYEFIGYEINGELVMSNSADVVVNANNAITVYFVEYGADLPLENVTRLPAENYIWGATDKTNNWNGQKTDPNGDPVKIIDNTWGEDTFYLGKMDLTGLESITARAALGQGGPKAYAFYADMTVDTENWSSIGDKKYSPSTAVTGGTLLATVTINNTDLNQWNNFTNFTAEATALSGKHDVYMKMVGGDNWHGCIDNLYFAYGDTASVEVSFVGKYNETTTTGTATSTDELMALLTNTKAPTIPGFTFLGWDDDRSAEELFETYKNDKFSITAVYEVDEDTTYAPTLGADFAAVDGKGNEVTGTTNLTFDSRVTVTAGLEKEVAYWVLDGAKVGFGKTSYTFYVSGQNNIDVVYADEVNETVTSSIVLQQSVAPYSGNAYTFSVVAQSSIVAGDNVSEYGVIYAASKEALDAVRSGETANTITVKSSKTAAGAQYITHLLQVKAGKTRVAMAYAVIDGVTVYSNQYATVTTPADGSAVTPVIANF